MKQVTNWIGKNIYLLIFSVISALMLSFGLYKFEKISYSPILQVLLYIFVFSITVILICYAHFIRVPKFVRVFGVIFALFLSVIYVAFWPIYFANGNESLRTSVKYLLHNCIYVLGLTILIAAAVTVIIYLIDKADKRLPQSNGTFFRHPILVIAVLFFCWLPCYLSYYPGVMSYDMYAQTPQAMWLEPITKYHPPLHTLFWRMCMVLEWKFNVNALVVYSILQMLIMAACLAYVLYFFANKKVHTIFLTIALVFFCLNPVIAIFSFIPTKDVLFSGALILFSVELLSLINMPKFRWGCAIRFVLFGLLSCLLRNNMIYALVAAFVFTLIILKKCRIRMSVCFVTIVLSYLIVQGPVYDKLGYGEGNSREMLSIPIQQLSYVVVAKGGELTGEDIQNINRYLPASELWYLYKTRNVDLIKVRFNTENFDRDPVAFLKLWANIFSRYTDECLVTFFNMHMPYWYPAAETIDPNTIAKYIETNIYPYEQTGYEIERSSKLPGLNKFYEEFVAGAKLNGPISLARLFSITTPIWMILFTMLVLVCRKKLALLPVVLPTFFLWCTYLLGPVSNCRYVLPIMLSYPIYMILVFQSSRFSLAELVDDVTNGPELTGGKEDSIR